VRCAGHPTFGGSGRLVPLPLFVRKILSICNRLPAVMLSPTLQKDMEPEAILGDDPRAREQALADAASAPEHVRSALAARLAALARDTAAALVAAEEAGDGG